MGYKIWITVPGHCYIIKFFSVHYVTEMTQREAGKTGLYSDRKSNRLKLTSNINNVMQNTNFVCPRCLKCPRRKNASSVVKGMDTRHALSSTRARHVNIIVSLMDNYMVKTLISCLNLYEVPTLINRFASEKRYAISCKDMTPLLRLLCSFFSARCYVDADKVFLRSAIALECHLILERVICNVKNCQDQYDILIDVTLTFYTEAIKVFNYLDDIKDMSPADIAAAAAADTASLGIESAVQVVGNVAAGAAISAIMDVAISSATIYLAKRKRDDGIISDKEFATKVKKTLCKSSLKFVGGTTGSIIGQLAIPVPIVGALVGGLCGSLIGTGIGIGINYGVFDRKEKEDKKVKEVAIASRDWGEDKPLYKRLLLLKVPKIVIYKEREKQFEDKLFPEKRHVCVTSQKTPAESKSTKREFLGTWRKKKHNAEDGSDNSERNCVKTSPTCILNRLKGDASPTPETREKSAENESVRVTSVTISESDQSNITPEDETKLTEPDTNPRRLSPVLRVKQLRKKFGDCASHNIEDNADNTSEKSPLTQNIQKMVRAQSVHTSPRHRFSFSSLKESLRSLSFTANNNENEQQDKNENEQQDKNENEQQNENENEPRTDANKAGCNGIQEFIRQSSPTECENGNDKSPLQTDHQVCNTNHDQDPSQCTRPPYKLPEADKSVNIINTTEGIKDNSLSPSTFKRISLQTIKHSFHSLSGSSDSDEKFACNDFRILRLEGDLNNNKKVEQLQCKSPHSQSKSIQHENTDTVKEHCVRRRKRSHSEGEEQLKHALRQRIFRERINSSPLIDTSDITERMKHMFTEQKPENTLTKNENTTKTKRADLSNVRRIFDSFGKKE